RHVTILDTKNFGRIAYVEVGATMVGKIIQNYKGKTFTRGQEKGMFLFGASTVMVYGEKGLWKPSQDILEHTHNGLEVLIQLGDQTAIRC
ncbi:MAG: phosphatidylserine decarboxylase, partial [Bdellovibrionales bacterium]|nr:phosphatidylserine decarboxylase [Bdellovibrionales bacterium]